MVKKKFELEVQPQGCVSMEYTVIVEAAYNESEAITQAQARDLFRHPEDIHFIKRIRLLDAAASDNGSSEDWAYVIRQKDYAEFLELKARDAYEAPIYTGLGESDDILCPACKTIIGRVDDYAWAGDVSPYPFCRCCGKRIRPKRQV